MRRRALRWAVRIVLGVLVIAVLAVGAAAITLHTDWGRDKVREQIEAKLAPYYPAGAHIGRLEGSVLGDFSLHEIVLTDREQRRAIVIDRVDVNVDLRAWFSDEARVEKLIIDGLKVELHQHGLEPPNLATMFKPNEEPLQFDVIIERLHIKNGAITIHKDGRLDHLDALGLEGKVTVLMNGGVAAEGALEARWRERDVPVSFGTDLSIDPLGVITVPHAHVGVGRVSATAEDIRAEGSKVTGRVHVAALEGALAEIAPELHPPRAPIDVHLGVAPIGANGLSFDLTGLVAGARVVGAIAAHPLEPRPILGGTLMIRGLDVSAMRDGMPSSSVNATFNVALLYDPEQRGVEALHGIVSMSGNGRVDAVRLDRLSAAAKFDGRSGKVLVEADGPGGLEVRASGQVTAEGRALVLEDGRLVARARDLRKATQGQGGPRMKMAGSFAADLAVSGRLEPGAPRLAIRGTIDGKDLRRDDVRVGSVAVRLDLDDVPAKPGGSATVRTSGVHLGPDELPDLVVTARGRSGGAFDVTADARDLTRLIDAHLAATVTLGDLERTYADVRLREYDVRVRGLKVEGQGGRIIAGRDRVTVRDVRGAVAGGTFAIDAVLPTQRPEYATGQIALEGISLDSLRGLGGIPERTRGKIDFKADVRKDHIHASIALRESNLGKLEAGIELIPPRRRGDPEAWKELDRRAIKVLHVDAREFDLAELGAALEVESPLAGVIHAAVHLDGAQRVAEVHARGLVAADLPVPVDADIMFDLDDPAVTKLDASATLRTIGKARVTAALRVPIRMFDPDAWGTLGLAAVDGATLQVEALEVDELMAARFGLGELRGVFTVQITASQGLKNLDATVLGREVRGGPLVEPIALSVVVNTSGSETRGHVVASLRGAELLDAKVSSPIDVLAELRRGLDPERIPVDGSITVRETELTVITAALGQDRRVPGRLHGTGTVKGTLASPIVATTIIINDLGMRTGRDGDRDRGDRGGARARRGRGGIKELKVIGRYERGNVHAEVHGRSEDGGTLDVVSKLALDRPEGAMTTIKAKDFELRPIARLVPDVLLGVAGKLDADLTIAGLVPETVRLEGTAKLSGATLPINDMVGVLRDGTVALTFKGAAMHATMGGKLEGGTIDVVADAKMTGVMPDKGTIDVTLRGVELITSSAPRIDAKLHADVDYDGAQVRIKATLREGKVRARGSKGRDLHPSVLPADLVFGSTAPGVDPPKPKVAQVRDFVGAEPVEPFLIVRLDIAPVSVAMPELRGRLTGFFDVAVGVDGASIEGQVEVGQGDVELLERRYRLRRALITFDGNFDPLLDVQVERDLAELTLYASITGRVSDPKLQLSSDPPNYTEGQLLSFAISDTAAAPGNETADAATNLVAAVASQTLLSYITPILPVRLDVVAYEPASASSSRAFVFGRWFTRKLLVLYRNRAEARPNENVNEAEAEYWLNQRVLLEGVAGDRGVLGLDLLWTRRW